MMKTSTWQQQDQERKMKATHFVAIPVSHSDIHSRVQTVQKKVVFHEKKLEPALIPVETLHLTLLVIHLENEQIEQAKEILQTLKDVLPSGAFTLKFKGLDFSFPEREKPWLRYVTPFGEEGIQKLKKVYDVVKKTFTEKGFPPTDPDREFHPHVTIINLNKAPNLQNEGISKLPGESFSACKDLDFGEEQVSSLCLYEMDMKKAKDGSFYYNCVGKTDF